MGFPEYQSPAELKVLGNTPRDKYIQAQLAQANAFRGSTYAPLPRVQGDLVQQFLEIK